MGETYNKQVKTHSLKILEAIELNHETLLKVNSSLVNSANCGQYFQVFAEAKNQLLPQIVYPGLDETGALLCCGDNPQNWLPGEILHIRGPRGNGFHLPPLAKRIALAAWMENGINRLFPLAARALDQKAEVVILCNTPISDIPAEIEVLPLNELGHMKTWADYLAVSMTVDHLPYFVKSLELIPGKPLPFQAEVLFDLKMPCDENSTCGVCGVLTSSGWKLGCKDGPVFQLADVMGEDSPHG